MILLGGVVLSAAGCMVPMYRMPAGYSGSYHRYLNRTAGTPADGLFRDTTEVSTAQPSVIRSPAPTRSLKPRGSETPASEQPPQPPRS